MTDEAYFYTLMCYIEQNPLKANMLKRLEEYPYSSYHYFLNYKKIPECLKDAWVVQNYKEDSEAIEAFLTNPVDSAQLQELRKASSLIAASNTDKRLKKEELIKRFENISDIKKRNRIILDSIEKGYSQHMIAKVLGISQQAVYGVVKRGRKVGSSGI